MLKMKESEKNSRHTNNAFHIFLALHLGCTKKNIEFFLWIGIHLPKYSSYQGVIPTEIRISKIPSILFLKKRFFFLKKSRNGLLMETPLLCRIIIWKIPERKWICRGCWAIVPFWKLNQIEWFVNNCNRIQLIWSSRLSL